LIWDLALAAVLVWLGHHARMKPWSLFALYVAGYSGYRIFEETIRVDSSEHFLGLRLNLFVAVALTVVGLVWFALAQRRPERPVTVLPASAAGSVEDVKPDEAAAVTADPEDAAHPAGDAGGDDAAMGDPGRGDDRDRGDAGDGSAADEAGADDATVATARSDE
jgi:hypothetical protein